MIEVVHKNYIIYIEMFAKTYLLVLNQNKFNEHGMISCYIQLERELNIFFIFSSFTVINNSHEMME